MTPSEPADPYALLEIERDASPEEIKRAYRRLAKRWHPDRNPGDPSAAERFKAIAQAFETLSSPERKLRHDARRTGSARDEDFLDRVADAVERGQRWAEEVVVPHFASTYRGSGAEMAVRFVKDASQLRPGRFSPATTALGRYRARRWLSGVDVAFEAGLFTPTALVRTRLGARILVCPDALWREGIQSAEQLDEAVLVLLVARYAQVIAFGRFVAPRGEGEEAWEAALTEAREIDTAAVKRAAIGWAVYAGVALLLMFMFYAGYTGW